MKHTPSLVGLGALVLSLGCSSGGSSNSNPLDGTWDIAFAVGTFTGTESFTLGSGGTETSVARGANTSCTGSWTTTGYTWTSTATTVTFSGTPICTGALMCGAVSFSCSQDTSQGLRAGSCSYALTNNDNTLTLTGCSWTTTTVVLTRGA